MDAKLQLGDRRCRINMHFLKKKYQSGWLILCKSNADDDLIEDPSSMLEDVDEDDLISGKTISVSRSTNISVDERTVFSLPIIIIVLSLDLWIDINSPSI